MTNILIKLKKNGFRNYIKQIVSHPNKILLVLMLILHIVLVFIYYIAPFLYNNNKTFQIFYISFIVSVIIGWLFLKGECWISLIEKQLIKPTYKLYDNPTINPSTDYMYTSFCDILNSIYNGLCGSKTNTFLKLNNKYIRELLPMVLPYLFVIFFLLMKFPKLTIIHRCILLAVFSILTQLDYCRKRELHL